VGVRTSVLGFRAVISITAKGKIVTTTMGESTSQQRIERRSFADFMPWPSGAS
jgi:hypothetical protein